MSRKKSNIQAPSSREAPIPTQRTTYGPWLEACLKRAEACSALRFMSITYNISVPFGAPYGEFGIYNTEYRTVIDLTNRRYDADLATSPSVIWADLDKFNLAPGTSVMVLNPNNIELCGNVIGSFDKTKNELF